MDAKKLTKYEEIPMLRSTENECWNTLDNYIKENPTTTVNVTALTKQYKCLITHLRKLITKAERANVENIPATQQME